MKPDARSITVTLTGIITVALLGLLLFVKPWQETGINDDFQDIKLEQIIAFAERANSAYHEAGIFRNEYGPHTQAGEFPETGLRVYVDSNPAAAAQWVVIRGTANMQDIFDDLDFIGCEEHELGINVHAGFDSALQECLPWILGRVDKTRPVWLTGHSLGGSVAALLVAVLDHRGFKNVCAITFGQPKFTDAGGAGKLAHLNILRILHDEDPVPMLPPVDVEGTGLSRYHHFGPEIIVRASGHFYYLPEHSPDRLDVAQIWEEIKNIRPMSHDMVKGYLPALKSALASAPGNPAAASVVAVGRPWQNSSSN